MKASLNLCLINLIRSADCDSDGDCDFDCSADDDSDGDCDFDWSADYDSDGDCDSDGDYDSDGDCDFDWRQLLTTLPSGHLIGCIKPE